MLFSVETQTTEERTQQYQSEIEAIYKDLTAKGKALMLSTELGVRFSFALDWKLLFFLLLGNELGITYVIESQIMFIAVTGDMTVIYKS